MAEHVKLTVFYDGDCAFCLRSVRVISVLDWLRRFRYRPLQCEEARDAGLWSSSKSGGSCHELPGEMILQSRPAIAGEAGSTEKRWGGWLAVKQIVFRLPLFYLVLTASLLLHPWTPLIVLLALSPLGNPAGAATYRLIARNRHRIPGAQCRLENP
jgi:predicted DCC family thiol-disulfide oxidoreductase YuxK